MTFTAVNSIPASDSQFIHIDEFLKDSRQQWWQWGGFLLFIVLVLSLLSLPLIYRMLLIVLSVVCVWFTQLRRPCLVAMSTLPANTSQPLMTTQTGIDSLTWQLGIISRREVSVFFYPIKNSNPHANTRQLWQGQLLASYRMGAAVILCFDITLPLPQRLSVTLWQDQMSDNAWRQLVSLANLHR